MGSRILDEAIGKLQRATTLDEIHSVVRTSARQLAGSQGATVVLREGDVCFYVDEDAVSPLWKGQRFPINECVSGWAMLHRQTAIVPDIHTDGRIPQDAYRPTFVRSLVMTPIGKEDPVGAIGVYWAQPRNPSSEEVALLQELARGAATALSRVGIAEAPVAPTLLADRSNGHNGARRPAVETS